MSVAGAGRVPGEKSSSDVEEDVGDELDEEEECVDVPSKEPSASVCVLSLCRFSVHRWHNKSDDCTSSTRQARWKGWLQSSHAVRESPVVVHAVQTSVRDGEVGALCDGVSERTRSVGGTCCCVGGGNGRSSAGVKPEATSKLCWN